MTTTKVTDINKARVARLPRNEVHDYKGVKVYVTYRKQTNDFEWVFFNTHTVKMAGVAPTHDKCVEQAARFIDRMAPPSGGGTAQ